ncbi:hypothetical protein CBOM_03578 [Ceraceosorus bombacis]|uniref:Uncharacterized protein n=1 Tax=Ceraceosorus bombacis TaxID=401625 RepID=A0A0P1BGU3_9BASI|nr:hypothetical protein CBOM_03578 [Ceraceosorus bombacis]
MEFYLVPDHHSQPHRLRAPRSAFGGAPSCGLDDLLCNLVQAPSTHRPARIPKPRHSSSFHPLVDLTLYQDQDRDSEDERQAIAFALTHHRHHRERERERERARQLQLEHYQLEQAREQQERQHRLSLENAQRRQEHKRQFELQRRHRQQEDLNVQIQHDFWQALQRQFFPSVQECEQERQAAVEAHVKQRARGEKSQIERRRAQAKEKQSDTQETFEGALQLGDAFLRAFFGAEPDEEKQEKKDEILEKATADQSTSETQAEPENAMQSHQELAVPRADGERGDKVSVEDTSSTPSTGQSSVTVKDIQMADAPSSKKETLNASSNANETVLFHYPHVAPTSYDAKNLKLALQGDQLRIEGLWQSSSPLESLSTTKHSPAQRQAQGKQKEGQEEKSLTDSSRSNSPHRGRSPRRARMTRAAGSATLHFMVGSGGGGGPKVGWKGEEEAHKRRGLREISES